MDTPGPFVDTWSQAPWDQIIERIRAAGHEPKQVFRSSVSISRDARGDQTLHFTPVDGEGRALYGGEVTIALDPPIEL